MQFKKVVLASFLALSLVACGDNDDKSKPDDDNKTKEPPKTEECIKAGDKCVLEDGKWVIKKEEEEPAPEVDTKFDYSGIGVTDELKEVRRGFGFYHKGEKSPLDKKRYPDSTVTLSPIISWSSSLNYDVDLWNFVAITPHDKDYKKGSGTKGKRKYMFDEIGVVNQKEHNKNYKFFGQKPVATKPGTLGISSFDNTTGNLKYMWARVPAVVNTFVFLNSSGVGVGKVYSDPGDKIWYNEERDSQTTANGGGSGSQAIRIYGVNAFLDDDTAHVGKFLTTGKTKPKKKDVYPLENRGGAYIKHANYVWWNPDDSRKAKAKVEAGAIVAAKAEYDAGKPDHERKKFPTDVEFGALNYVQFGRLTGEGVRADAPRNVNYKDPLIKVYPFASGKSTSAGNDKAEDWYFARGTEPTPVETVKAMQKSDAEIVYDGQALMFGLDYDPAKSKSNDIDDQSTNSVLPGQSKDKARVQTTLLDGKQNFVRMIWRPKEGAVTGEVYGVWTKSSYYVANKKVATNIDKGQIVPLVYDKKEQIITYATDNTTQGQVHISETKLKDTTNGPTIASNIIDNAIEIDAWRKSLVKMSGHIVDGTNMFRGVAIRCKDEDKGLFTGAFFGGQANEMGGVIDSQTGDMSDPKLVDPTTKWGGSFGAHRRFDSSNTIEYLDFPLDKFDFDTSNEVY